MPMAHGGIRPNRVIVLPVQGFEPLNRGLTVVALILKTKFYFT